MAKALMRHPAQWPSQFMLGLAGLCVYTLALLHFSGHSSKPQQCPLISESASTSAPRRLPSPGSGSRGAVVESQGSFSLLTGQPWEEAAFRKLAGYDLPTQQPATGLPLAAPVSYAADVAARATFAREFANKPVEGWCEVENGYVALLMSAKQHCLGLFGSVGEIGVHHGLFWLALAHTAASAPVAEQRFACDLFEKLQSENIDKSGAGNRPIFEANMQKFGIAPSQVSIVEGSSLKLSPGVLAQQGVKPFRLLSVDGGHTFAITVADILLAANVTMEGGIIVIDDIFNVQWMGVREALYFVFSLDLAPNLRPFLMTNNKLWLTTAAYQPIYSDFIMKSSCLMENSMVSYLPGTGRSAAGGVDFPVLTGGGDPSMLTKCWEELVSSTSSGSACRNI